MNAIYNGFKNITELKVKRDSLIKFIGKLEFRLFILCNSDLAIPRYLLVFHHYTFGTYVYITYAKKKRHSCFMRNAQIKFSCLYDIKCIKEQHLMRHLGTISSDENETNEKIKLQ